MAEPNSQAQDPTRDSAAGAYFDDLLTRVEKPTAPAPAAATAEPMSRVQQLEAAMAGDDRAFDTPPEDSGARLENQVGASILSGAAKAFFETSDTLTGLSGLGGGGMGNLDYEPKFEDKSRIRNAIETSQQQRENQPGMAGSMNSLARNVAQFTTGMVGFKKIPGLRGKGFTGATVRGAAVGALAFDPHEERLSNFLSKNLAFTKPVTEFLAADENLGAPEGGHGERHPGRGRDLSVRPGRPGHEAAPRRQGQRGRSRRGQGRRGDGQAGPPGQVAGHADPG
jgi:hypothetical protein